MELAWAPGNGSTRTPGVSHHHLVMAVMPVTSETIPNLGYLSYSCGHVVAIQYPFKVDDISNTSYTQSYCSSATLAHQCCSCPSMTTGLHKPPLETQITTSRCVSSQSKYSRHIVFDPKTLEGQTICFLLWKNLAWVGSCEKLRR